MSRDAVKEALGYLDWIHDVAADWPDVDENYEKVAAAARLVADGEVTPKADMTEIRWCATHNAESVENHGGTSDECWRVVWADDEEAVKYPYDLCNIVSSWLWTEEP